MEEEFTYGTERVYGYKYLSEDQAIESRNSAADYKGFPVPGGGTLYWVNYEYALDDGFWFIRYDLGVEVVLGPAYEFDVTIRNYITIID